MNQRTFDFEAGQRFKQAGIDQAADNKQSLLAFARDLAVSEAASKPDRCITADDVAEALQRNGISVRALGNAAGALFRGGRWEWTGRRIKSRRPHAHANELKVWKLK